MTPFRPLGYVTSIEKDGTVLITKIGERPWLQHAKASFRSALRRFFAWCVR